MQELGDIALLRRYLEQNSEEAFATLVSRHTNKVYSVALRHTRNPQQAEEITQAVFVILAKKSPRLGRKVVLSGWLYETSRLTAATFIRSDIRRARREQEAYTQTLLNEAESDVWPQIAPLLDAAMAGLSETDRHAVVLRFFDGKSMREVGAALGASEDAAKMRLNRAVEKLRAFLTRRGVVLSAAVLTAAISANSVQAAPAMLANTAAVVAFTRGVTASTSTLALIKGALKVMAWTKAKTAIIVGAVALLVAGTVSTVAVKTVINRKMEAVEAYRGQVWQQKYDLSIVDRLPPQVMILPVLRSRAAPGAQFGALRNGKGVGLGVGVPELVECAYDVSLGRVIFSTPIPIGRYDFIDNLPAGQPEALQQAVKKKFGLTGRRQLIETNVLVLTAHDRNAAGLRPVSGQDAFNMENGSISGRNRPFAVLIYCLEDRLKTPVLNRTGLDGSFDFDLKWDGTPEELKRAVQQQLGLELVPGRETVEFVVVSREK